MRILTHILTQKVLKKNFKNGAYHIKEVKAVIQI